MAIIASSMVWPMEACLALRLDPRPARRLGHPEDPLGAVLVAVLRVGTVGGLLDQPRVQLLEGVGDVLEEHEAEDDVLVLASVHVVAQLVGGLEQGALEAEVAGSLGFGWNSLGGALGLDGGGRRFGAGSRSKAACPAGLTPRLP
jgi:hypothetical protein